MKKQLKSLMILGMTGLLAACGGKGSKDLSTDVDNAYKVIEPDGRNYGISGLAAKKTYRTLIYFSNAVPNLNYMETSEAADAQHFANFVDGLLCHNEYGVLEKNLATEVTHNEDYTKFSLKIKDNVPWVTYDGVQYEAVVDGTKTKQYVQPSDWVASAKAILTAQNASTLEYLISNFVKGAAEYYYYTELMYKIATDATTKKLYDGKPEKQAQYINNQIKANKENVYNAVYKDNPVTGDDLPGIKNLSRLGIKANDEERTLTYELIQGAFYFPTLLTYSCYLPVNQYFLNDVRFTGFGVKNDKILYNGPFLFAEEGDNQLTYKRNKSYFDQSIINVDEIIYTVYDNTIGNDYTRTQYFNGNIDGFGLSTSDTVGWKQFITGEDNSGSVYNPVSGDVYARLLDTIGSMYGSNISLARASSGGTTAESFSTKGSAASVANTEKALSLEPVRRAILNALDYDAYYCNYGTTEPFKSQYKVNTYTPKNFVQSSSGDYVTNHYYNEYAKQKGIPSGTSEGNGAHMENGELVAEEGSAAWILENGRIDRCSTSDAEVASLAQEAKLAIQAYNALHTDSPITLPVQVEFYTAWDVDTTGDAKKYDGATIASMNKRLNNTKSESVSDYSLFYVVPTDKITSSNADTISHAGAFDYSPVLWGWGADYGDPLTYMNTYTKGGDWKSIFPYVGRDYVANYNWDYETHTLAAENDLLADYTTLVNKAAAITDDINARYNKFAEAEYMLIEELSIYMPQINYGQGWSCSISRAAGYHMPQSNYGLSSDRMTGLWVLETALTAQERREAKAKYDAAKKAYVDQYTSVNIY